MKALLIIAALVAAFFIYRVFTPVAELAPLEAAPVDAAASADDVTAPFPDSHSLVMDVCERRVLANSPRFSEISEARAALSANGAFINYIARVVVTDADSRSHEETWVCRYYPDGTTQVRQTDVQEM